MSKLSYYFKKSLARCVFMGMFAILLLRAGGADSVALALSCGQWNNVTNPGGGGLFAVAAVSPDDVWAVGEQGNGSNFETFTEHWDGTQWSIIPSPNASASDALNAVSGISTNDVWAVGNTLEVGSTMMEHWNGAQWSIVSSPSPTPYTFVYGVAAVATNDVWAVGTQSRNGNGTGDVPLIEHWNGSQWSLINLPDPGNFNNTLNAVTAISANDIWAVGNYQVTGSTDWQTLMEHWDGTQWSVVKSPNLKGCDYLYGATTVAMNDIWAVGSHSEKRHCAGVQSGSGGILIEHWNGTRWSVVPNPKHGGNSELKAVAASSTNDIWAVGNTMGISQTLTEHWDGTRWSVVPSPNPGPRFNFLSGVVHTGNGFWAVGYDDAVGAFTEFYC